MNTRKRPLSVTILAWIYIAIGVIAFAAHFPELLSRNAPQNDAVSMEIVELLAIVCGAFVLRGHQWARWLMLVWIASHAILSAFHALPEFAIHCLFCAVTVWILFLPESARYFGHPQTQR